MATARKKYEYISIDDNYVIKEMISDRYSAVEIARWLKRPKGSINTFAYSRGLRFTARGRDAE